MAIERMKSVWLFAPRGKARDMLDRLARMGLCHVADCGDAGEEDRERLGIDRVFPDVGDIERRVQLLRETLDTLTPFHKTDRDFLENFITTPVEITKAEVVKALHEVDVEKMHAEVKRRERDRNAARASLEKAEAALKAMADFEGVEGLIPGAGAQRVTAAFLGTLSAVKAAALREDDRLPEPNALAVIAQRKRKVVLQAVCMAESRDELEALLREYGCDPIEPEQATMTVADYIGGRRDEVTHSEADVEEKTSRLSEIAKANRNAVEAALGYWEERLRIARAAGLLAESRRLTILKVFVRERDMAAFREKMAAELPGVTMDVRDPEPGENVPVSLKNSRIFAPASFLVGMFGMPNYFTFDPTPYIVTSFLVFFGFCFGDAVYGVLMVIMGLLLGRKYRDYPGPRSLFHLLAIAGIPTFIMGAVTGSWAADLFSAKYLPEGSPLAALCDNAYKFDMIQKSLLALGIALMFGVVNQFLSLICLMVRNVRQGDKRAAVFDGGFWLLVLPAVVLVAAALFVNVPKTLSHVAYAAAGVGAVGLVLTQGREEKSFVGKAAIGVVSLYGIVGSYGITAFIGDILSYSRLLALGLTTAIVGMCFNLIGGLAAEMAGGLGKPLGIALFLVIVVLGHTMNFLISLLGAFVHSARLIFVEFFGKFYQGDAQAFAPIGSWTGRICVVDAPAVWWE